MFFSFFQGMGFQVATFRDESSHLKDTISRKLLGCWPLCLLKCRLCHVVWTKNGMFYRYIFETKTIKSANQIAVDGSEIQLTTIKHMINNLVRYQAEVPFMFTMNLHLPSVCVFCSFSRFSLCWGREQVGQVCCMLRVCWGSPFFGFGDLVSFLPPKTMENKSNSIDFDSPKLGTPNICWAVQFFLGWPNSPLSNSSWWFSFWFN